MDASDALPDTIQPTSRPWLRTLSWVLLGIVGVVVGVWVAFETTVLVIENSAPDPQAGLLMLVTLPFGYAVGAGCAMLLARTAERRNPSAYGQITRQSLTWTGVEIPIGVAVIGGIIFSTIVA